MYFEITRVDCIQKRVQWPQNTRKYKLHLCEVRGDVLRPPRDPKANCGEGRQILTEMTIIVYARGRRQYNIFAIAPDILNERSWTGYFRQTIQCYLL